MSLATLLRLIAATCALLFAGSAAGQTAAAGVPMATCVAPARAGDEPAAMLRATARFDCRTPQLTFGAGDFWVRAASVPVGAGSRPRVLRSWSLWQRSATLYLQYADGAVVRRNVDDVDAARSIALGAVFEQAVPVRGVPLHRIMWHVRGAANIRGIVTDARLATPEQSGRRNLLFATLYGAFGGLCLALLVYNLTLWVALRHRFQLAYCGMVAALAAYAFSSSGAMSWLWPEMGNVARLRVNYAALAAAAIAALSFARHFFEARVVGRWMNRAVSGVMTYLAAATATFVLLAPWRARALDLGYAAGFVAVTVLAAVLLVRAWRARSNYLWVFGIAWAAPLLLAACRTMSSLHLIASSMWLDNSTIGAMTLEALASSVAIAYRIRLLSVERDEARARELTARMLADTDPLTSLLNRRAFLREVLAAQGSEPRHLVLADLDHFKRVNETLGHDGGDEVLRRVAHALQGAAPPGALVARIGGEEFAILAPGDVPGLPDRILAAVRAAPMPFDVAVTASVGSDVGQLASEADWATLYRMADQALFAAKAAGRDRSRTARLLLAA